MTGTLKQKVTLLSPKSGWLSYIHKSCSKCYKTFFAETYHFHY